jgi:hypothetical protein
MIICDTLSAKIEFFGISCPSARIDCLGEIPQNFTDDGHHATSKAMGSAQEQQLCCCQPCHSSEYFTPDDWTELRKLNRKTTDRVHDGLLPTLSDGRPYIILAHADYSPEMVEFLQNIGFKAHIISDPSKLVVKHEYALW